MKKIYSISVFIFLLLVFISCGSVPKNYQFDKVQTYNMQFDVVWGKIVRFFGISNIPIKTIDKSSGIIATEYNLDANSKYLDCGTGGLIILKNYSGNFNIIVEKIDTENTKVYINANFNCDAVFDKSVSIRKCNSTGILEKEIFEYILK